MAVERVHEYHISVWRADDRRLSQKPGADKWCKGRSGVATHKAFCRQLRNSRCARLLTNKSRTDLSPSKPIPIRHAHHITTSRERKPNRTAASKRRSMTIFTSPTSYASVASISRTILTQYSLIFTPKTMCKSVRQNLFILEKASFVVGFDAALKWKL
jgi:hypothetical protein